MNKIIKEKLDFFAKKNDIIIVAIEGKCTSGKTTLAKEIEEEYDCNIFHMDDFFLTNELRTPERLSEIGCNVDYVRFKNEVADKIRNGNSFTYRKFDCSVGKIGKTIEVTPKKLNIVEGVYSMHPSLVKLYDYKIFLMISPEEQLNRLESRNTPEKVQRFINEWIPKENTYFEHFNIESECDLVTD